MRHLPEAELRLFVQELLETGDSSDAAVSQLVAEWRHTAEVHADPELCEILQRDSAPPREMST